MAFVGIYSHNKDLVDDSLAGCAYIKEASQREHQETLLLFQAVRRLASLLLPFISFSLCSGNESRQSLSKDANLQVITCQTMKSRMETAPV